MRAALMVLLQRLVARFDPAWCGGCSDTECDDCKTEWHR